MFSSTSTTHHLHFNVYDALYSQRYHQPAQHITYTSICMMHCIQNVITNQHNTSTTLQYVWCIVFTTFSPTRTTHHLHTHHITGSSISPHRPNNFNSQDFNHGPILTHIYITYTILTKIINIFNCYGVPATHLITFVQLCSYNTNITLKMAAIAAETCCWEHYE